MNRTEADLTGYFHDTQVDTAAEQRLERTISRLVEPSAASSLFRFPGSSRRKFGLLAAAAVTAIVLLSIGVTATVLRSGHSNSPADPTVSVAPAATGPVDSAFQTRALATCTSWTNYSAAHPFPVPGFDPTSPTATDLRAIAAWGKTLRTRATQWGGLNQLGTPRTGTLAWQAVLTIMDKAITITRDQDQAITTTNTSRYAVDYWKLDSLLAEDFPGALTAAGFPTGNACQLYFSA